MSTLLKPSVEECLTVGFCPDGTIISIQGKQPYTMIKKILVLCICLTKIHLPAYLYSMKPKGLLKCESRFHSVRLILSLWRNRRMLGRKAFLKLSSSEFRRDSAHVWECRIKILNYEINIRHRDFSISAMFTLIKPQI